MVEVWWKLALEFTVNHTGIYYAVIIHVLYIYYTYTIHIQVLAN